MSVALLAAQLVASIFSDGFESGDPCRWSNRSGCPPAEIFADGFESGDTQAWSRTEPEIVALWGDPLPAGRRLQGVCVALGAHVSSPVGKPPLEVRWDVGLDEVVDMYSSVVSTSPADVEREITVEWTPSEQGPTPVGLELVNPYGRARIAFLYDVRDPATHGACCLLDGSCFDVLDTGECSAAIGTSSLGLYCSQVDCTPIPTPTWRAQCLFGFCVFDAGTPVTFVATDARGPWRYAWETPAAATECGAFGPPSAEQPQHAFPPGEWRPCVELQDLAGRVVQLREDRVVQVF